MLWSLLGLSPRDKSVALHRSVGAMISKEIYIKRRRVRTEGMIKMLSHLIMKKYHKDATDYLKQCNEDELERISDLMNDNVPYESLVKQYMVD